MMKSHESPNGINMKKIRGTINFASKLRKVMEKEYSGICIRFANIVGEYMGKHPAIISNIQAISNQH